MNGRTHRARRIAGLAAAVAGLAAITGVVAVTAHASSPPAGPGLAFHGNAFGSRVKTGTSVTSGPSFEAVSACGAKAGQSWSNTGLSANVPGAVRSGSIANKVSALQTKTGPAIRSTSTLQKVSLLAGMIRGQAVDAVSKVSLTSTGRFAFADNSTMGRLVISGKPVALQQPSQKVQIPGVGYAIIDQERRVTTSVGALQTVNLIHIYVTAAGNKPGLAPGTSIIIGHATASLAKVANALVGGISFGSRFSVGKTISSGASAPSYMPCYAGSDSNETSATNLQSAGTIGKVVTSTAWSRTNSKTTAAGSSTVSSVNLFGGKIQGRQLSAMLNGTQTGSTYAFKDGSTAAHLVVNGSPINPTIPQKIAIPNVGVLYVHHVIKGAKSETVRMLDLVVSKSNSKLPVGTHVVIAVTKITFRN